MFFDGSIEQHIWLRHFFNDDGQIRQHHRLGLVSKRGRCHQARQPHTTTKFEDEQRFLVTASEEPGEMLAQSLSDAER